MAEDDKEHHNPLSGFQPKGALAGQQVLDELARGQRDRGRQGGPRGRRGVPGVAAAVAQAAADAAKEGGFLGFHAVRVSEGEQRMLDKLGEALAAPAA